MSGKAPPRFTADGEPIPPRAAGPIGGLGRQDAPDAYEAEEVEDRHKEAMESIFGEIQAKRDHYYPNADSATGQDVSEPVFEDFFDKAILGAAYAAGEVVAANPSGESVPNRNARIYREALENAYNGEIPDPETDAARQARLVASEIHMVTVDKIAESVLTPDVTAQERQAIDHYLNEPDTDLDWQDDE